MALSVNGLDIFDACEGGMTETVEALLDRGAEADAQDASGVTALVIACEMGHTETAKVLLDRGAEVNLQMKDGSSALVFACDNGMTEVAKVLLDRGAEVDLQRGNGWSALMAACTNGNSETVKLLLDRGAKVDLQDEDGWTALMVACQDSHADAVKVLLDRGAEVNRQKKDGWSALMIACENGMIKVLKLLLDRGGKVDLLMENGWSALMSASTNGHAEAAKLLLDRGAEVNLQTTDGSSALMFASENGMTEVIKVLLDRGAKVDLRAEDGSTALMSSCQRGHVEAANLLFDRGAEVDLQCKDGVTALVIACEMGHTETAKVLLDRGAEVDRQKEDGWSALMYACQNGHTDAATLLLDRGAEVDLQTTDGWSALMLACHKGLVEAAELLLDRGAEVDRRKEDGCSALTIACHQGHTEAARQLLDRAAEVNVQMKSGSSALMLACQKGHAEAAELLLDRGAKVNLQDSGGWTALMEACELGHAKAVALLLDRSAEVDLQDSYGRTALMWACDNAFAEAVKLLLDRGAKVDMQDAHGGTALVWTTECELSDLEQAETDQRIVSIITLLCMGSNRQSFADLGGPAALDQAKEKEFKASAELLVFLSEPSSFANYGLSLKTLACFYARNVRTPQAAADFTGPELYFMGIRDTAQRHELMERFQAAAAKDEQSGGQRRGQEAIDSNLEDLESLLSSRPLAAPHDFDVAIKTVREAKLALKDLQAGGAELFEARDKLASLRTALGALQVSINRLETSNDAAAVENVCRRIWARLSDEPLADQSGHAPFDQDMERACQAALAAIASWKQLAPLPMDEMPLVEIRCALELIARRQVTARQTELTRRRAAAHAIKTEVGELVKTCVKPSTTAVGGLIDRIYDVKFERDELKRRIRYARGKRARAGASADVDELAKLELELANLPSVHKLECELWQKRARAIRQAERYFPALLQDSVWREQIGLSSEALIGVGNLELSSVTRAGFAQDEKLATKPGKEVYKVTDPNGRVMVLKSFRLSNASWYERFCRQVQALAELKSAYLVRIEALFLDASFGCILTPYYAGGDLAGWIRDNPHASEDMRKRLAVGVLSGVHDLHQHNLVHCDITPEKIFLTQALTPVLGAFDGIQMSDETMTQPLQTTARYAAPELRADGVIKVTPAVDLFSISVVLGEIFPAASGALWDLMGKLQARDPTLRPSALEALCHEAFRMDPTRSCECQVCKESFTETDGVCCESAHFVCKSCLGGAVRAASQPGAHVQLQRDCSMLCLAQGCERELPGGALAGAVPDEFESLLKIVRGHFERETAADTEKEVRRRVNMALRAHNIDPALREHVEHIQNKILTLSCSRCETAFSDFEGCCALRCSNSSCAGYFCAWCLQDHRRS